MRLVRIPKMIEPITLKMIKAGSVATAHLTIRTTIDINGILMSVTTTLLCSVTILLTPSQPRCLVCLFSSTALNA